MKKLLLFIAIIFLLVSCSSESENTNQIDFIGKWTIETESKYFEYGTMYAFYDESEDECYQMTTYEFTTESQMIKDSYDFDSFNCIRNPIRTYNYTFENGIITINGNEYFEFIESTQTYLKLKKLNQNNTYSIIEYSKVN